jgi:hypothetical protein
MRRCILHFGMPKTGSTSIQATLLAARPLQDAVFLNVGIGNSSRLLATLFMADPGRFHLNRKWGLDAKALAPQRERAFEVLEDQIATAQGRPCLISAEALSMFEEDTLVRLRDWFAQRFDRLEVVGYVRAPRGYMDSEFQQKIKSGRGQFRPGLAYPGYAERFGKLERVFGREQVHYWKFDPASFPGHNVVEDFLQRVGIDIPREQHRRVNESLGRAGLCLLYIYRRYGPGYGKGKGSVEQNYRLERELREIPDDPRSRLADRVALPILARHRSDTAWMEQRLGSSLDEPLRGEDPLAIATEDDLLHPGDAALDWLARRVEQTYDPASPPDTAGIAAWVHALRERVAPRDTQGRQIDTSPLVHRRKLQAGAAANVPLPGAGGWSPLPPDAEAGRRAAWSAVMSTIHARLVPGEPLQVESLGTFSPLPAASRLRFDPEV